MQPETLEFHRKWPSFQSRNFARMDKKMVRQKKKTVKEWDLSRRLHLPKL